MKILFITHHDGFLGSSKSLFNLIQGLSAYPVQPFVIVPKKSLFTEALEKENVPYRILPITNWVSATPMSFRREIRWIKDTWESIHVLRQAIHDWDIDLVYSNSSIFPVGRCAALFEGIPHVWHIREFGDLDYELKFLFPKNIAINFIRSSSTVICNSQAVKEYHFIHKAKGIHVIYNGIATKTEFEAFLEQKQLQEQLEGFSFCTVGHISAKKGTETAIKALSKLVGKGIKARLIIAGNGIPQYVKHCKTLVEDLNLSDNVKFLGYIRDPYAIYFNSDCLLMCSEHEAMGRVTVEAMSACLPVIGKHSGGTPEIIEHGITGYLYFTFDELVEAMERIVNDHSQGRKLGLQGWKRARQKFSIEDYAANVFQVIDSIR